MHMDEWPSLPTTDVKVEEVDEFVPDESCFRLTIVTHGEEGC
jgi:hypothetical protein